MEPGEGTPHYSIGMDHRHVEGNEHEGIHQSPYMKPRGGGGGNKPPQQYTPELSPEPSEDYSLSPPCHLHLSSSNASPAIPRSPIGSSNKTALFSAAVGTASGGTSPSPFGKPGSVSSTTVEELERRGKGVPSSNDGGRGSSNNSLRRADTSPIISSPPSSMTSYVNRLLGSSSPFSEYRKAKNRLQKYRNLLQSEVSKTNLHMYRSTKALKAFEEGSRREELQLFRMGDRRHVGLHKYYCSVKCTLLCSEFEMYRQAAKILETRENEVSILVEHLEEILKDGGELDDAFLRNPAELVAADMMIVNLKKRIHWLNKACAQVRQDLTRETAGVSVDVEESMEERRRKLLHLIEECKVLYFGGATERWDRHDPSSCVEEEGGGGGGGGRILQQQQQHIDESATMRSSMERDAEEAKRPSASYLQKMRKPLFVRQKEVMQLRMKYEREFAHLIEDERYREGRLLRRWFELLEGGTPREVASLSNFLTSSTPSGNGGQRLPGEFLETPVSSSSSNQRPRSLTHSERSQGSLLFAGPLPPATNHGLATSSSSSSLMGVAQAAPLSSSRPASMTSNYSQMHAPRSIVAFINYFAIKRIKEPYQMDDSLRPVLIGLTQSLIFRRARRVVFGYVNSSMKSLNLRWRQRIRRARQLSARDIGVPEAYLPMEDLIASIKSSVLLDNSNDAEQEEGDRSQLTYHHSNDYSFPTSPNVLLPPSPDTLRESPEEEKEKGGVELDPANDSAAAARGKGPTTNVHIGPSPSNTKAVATASKGTNVYSHHHQHHHQQQQHFIDALTRPPYHETSLALGEMSVCLTPQEMSDCLIASMKCLHYEAMLISGNARALDADTMFPILLYALIHADLPDMYSCLYCLRNFGTGDHAGEKAYYITCLEAAVAHLDRLELPLPLMEGEEGYDSDDEALEWGEGGGGGGSIGSRRGSTVAKGGRVNGSSGRGEGGEWVEGGLTADRTAGSTIASSHGDEEEEEEEEEAEMGPSFSREDQIKAMLFLDQWLGIESAMEEAIDVLEKDGWF